MPCIQQSGPVNVEIGPKRIVALQGFPDAINTGLGRQFFLKATKHPVPDNKYTAVVLIYINLVLSMVYTVI
jgi:hypothetical protein